MPKVIRTYSIDEDLYKWFNKHCKDTSLNRSGFISKKIEELKEEIENKNKPQETK